MAAAGNDLDGFVVQPQIQGKRELVAGLFRDPQFGPVIMFGIGGVFTEAIADVSFRLAPLSEGDAADMLTEIRAKALLDEYRGEAAINRSQIIQTLLGISRIGTEIPEIAEQQGRRWTVNWAARRMAQQPRPTKSDAKRAAAPRPRSS